MKPAFLICRSGTVPILRKNCLPFHLFPAINPAPPHLIKDFYIFHLLLLITTPPLFAHLIHHIFSWKSKLKHTGVTCFFSRCKMLTNKT